MSTLELHAHTAEGSTHVCMVHRGTGDETPLQMISAQSWRGFVRPRQI